MLPGEPTWLAVFGPRSPTDERDPQDIVLRSKSSAWALQLTFGDDLRRPQVAEAAGCAAVMDGFLLDRRPLESALGARIAAEVEGDAGLVLNAYLELGERALPLLRGAFGLLIWDARHDRLLCTRDLGGAHPLFFSRSGDRVLVAASQGALLDSGRVSPDVDRLAIARWVVSVELLPSSTFYAKIERLPPGYVFTTTPDGATIRRHWHPAEDGTHSDLGPDQALDTFEELLDQAVSRWSSLGRLGVFLSGGADSGAVAASAAAVSRTMALSKPLALSLVFPEPAESEEPTQRSIASGLDIPQRVISLDSTISREGLLMDAVRLTERSWLPPVNPWAASYVAVAQEGRHHGCHAILTGEGGNTWFEPEWSEVADLTRRLKLLQIRRLWLQERGVRTSAARTARAFAWRHGVRLVLRDTTLRLLGRLASDAPRSLRRRRLLASLPRGWAFADDQLRGALVNELAESTTSLPRGSYREFADQTKLESTYLYQPAESFFLVSRRLGLFVACPVLDPDFVGFLYGLPNALLSLGGRAKGLPRESIRWRAGDQPAERLGIGRVDAYLGKIVREEGPRVLEALGGLKRLGELGVVDEAAFGQALRGSGLGRKVGYYEAWQTLACEAWLRSCH
jgi:hypothetical protein